MSEFSLDQQATLNKMLSHLLASERTRLDLHRDVSGATDMQRRLSRDRVADDRRAIVEWVTTTYNLQGVRADEALLATMATRPPNPDRPPPLVGDQVFYRGFGIHDGTTGVVIKIRIGGNRTHYVKWHNVTLHVRAETWVQPQNLEVIP